MSLKLLNRPIYGLVTMKQKNEKEVSSEIEIKDGNEVRDYKPDKNEVAKAMELIHLWAKDANSEIEIKDGNGVTETVEHNEKVEKKDEKKHAGLILSMEKKDETEEEKYSRHILAKVDQELSMSELKVMEKNDETEEKKQARLMMAMEKVRLQTQNMDLHIEDVIDIVETGVNSPILSSPRCFIEVQAPRQEEKDAKVALALERVRKWSTIATGDVEDVLESNPANKTEEDTTEAKQQNEEGVEKDPLRFLEALRAYSEDTVEKRARVAEDDLILQNRTSGGAPENVQTELDGHGVFEVMEVSSPFKARDLNQQSVSTRASDTAEAKAQDEALEIETDKIAESTSDAVLNEIDGMAESKLIAMNGGKPLERQPNTGRDDHVGKPDSAASLSSNVEERNGSAKDRDAEPLVDFKSNKAEEEPTVAFSKTDESDAREKSDNKSQLEEDDVKNLADEAAVDPLPVYSASAECDDDSDDLEARLLGDEVPKNLSKDEIQPHGAQCMETCTIL